MEVKITAISCLLSSAVDLESLEHCSTNIDSMSSLTAQPLSSSSQSFAFAHQVSFGHLSTFWKTKLPLPFQGRTDPPQPVHPDSLLSLSFPHRETNMLVAKQEQTTVVSLC